MRRTFLLIVCIFAALCALGYALYLAVKMSELREPDPEGDDDDQEEPKPDPAAKAREAKARKAAERKNGSVSEAMNQQATDAETVRDPETQTQPS